MLVHAIQNVLGGYKQVENGVEFTHWIIDKKTFKEYYDAKKYFDDEVPKLQNTVKSKNKKISELEKQLSEAREVASQNYDYVEEHKADMQAQKERYSQIIQESENNKKTIDKVLAVCKERANKERNLKDKKHNAGYVILSTEEYKHRAHNKDYYLYKTIIQLPFFTELSKDEIIDLWNADKQRKQFFYDVGLGNIEKVDMYNTYEMSKILSEEAECCIISYKFKRNFVKGFWEIELIHNSEVNI